MLDRTPLGKQRYNLQGVNAGRERACSSDGKPLSDD